jgi:hypothetical protein
LWIHVAGNLLGRLGQAFKMLMQGCRNLVSIEGGVESCAK